ncbi:MAG: glycosyltransferase family 4 protein [Microgenomates group bacterium]
MLIAIDGNEANVGQRVGVSVYTLNLLKYFQKNANQETNFLIFLRNKPLADLPKENLFFRYQVIPAKILWSQVFLPFHLFFKKNIDVFFAPAHYSPRFLKIPLVVTVHDLSYFYYPNEFLKTDLYKLSHWTQYSVKKAKKIIAVSETTKKDLITFYDLPEDKIEVIYNGYEKKVKTQKSKTKNCLKNFKIDPYKYILYVGTIQPRKNTEALIRAFFKFKKDYPDFKLVVTGKKGWLYQEIFEIVKELKLEKEIVFTGYVDDKTLVILYQNAFCFVMPSLYEGFCLPLLEAMSNDCPVICSSAPSLPEIGADACLYFDPKNIDELYNQLTALKNDYQLKKELIEKGKERVKSFSWENCAQETLTILKNAVL